mmetsp:Transcript_7779/g.15231  ORF Transcript_7779/g.15231 Transcript_7779/m.15231 type:complete len:88 (+) Transcript_7779:2-265(+)
MQDWALGHRRCKCCCHQDYAGLPARSAKDSGLLALSPSPFVHLGRSSTLAHSDMRLAGASDPASLAALVRRHCSTIDQQAPFALRAA